MRGSRFRFWLNQFLSGRSLATAGAAAVGLVGWATTQNPLFGWVMLGGGGAWTALMYYLTQTSKGIDALPESRAAALREIEDAQAQFSGPPPGEAGQKRNGEWKAGWQLRQGQLRRVVQLEQLIMNELPHTPSGVDLLSAEQQLEVSEFVDQAIELARRRVLLLRALHANPRSQVEAELRDLIGKRQGARERVAGELEELVTLKREQAERIARWEDDLHLSEINLDQIETFLRAVAYDQTVTPTNVSERITRLKGKVQARRDSVEELERRINEAVS